MCVPDVGAFCLEMFDIFFDVCRVCFPDLVSFFYLHVFSYVFPVLLLHFHFSVLHFVPIFYMFFSMFLVFCFCLLVLDFAVTFLIPWCMF